MRWKKAPVPDNIPPEALKADTAVTADTMMDLLPTRDPGQGRGATGMEEGLHHQAAEEGRPQRLPELERGPAILSLHRKSIYKTDTGTDQDSSGF